MSYPQTGTSFYDSDGKNRTGTSLSTNIIIKVGKNTIGAIQSLNYSEQRQIHKVSEVGTDGVIDSAPQSSVNINGSCTRIRFDRLRVAEAFSRGFVHVHAQRYPFDIDIIDTVKGDGNNAIVTTLRNVWISGITTTYTSSDFVISDQMNFEAESIESYFAGGTTNIAEGGERGPDFIFFQDGIERAADRGERRGALDAPGLITSFLGRNPF